MTFEEAKKNLEIDNCFYAGYISRSHGYKGQFSSKIFFDLQNIKTESILVEINKLLIPFFIDFKKSNFDSVPQIIKFIEIDSIEEANFLSGKRLFIPSELIDDNIDEYLLDRENFVVGFSIIDKKIGSIGEIINFIDDRKNPLFTVEYKDSNQFIPLNSISIEKIDYKNKLIYCSIPDNILEL